MYGYMGVDAQRFASCEIEVQGRRLERCVCVCVCRFAAVPFHVSPFHVSPFRFTVSPSITCLAKSLRRDARDLGSLFVLIDPSRWAPFAGNIIYSYTCIDMYRRQAHRPSKPMACPPSNRPPFCGSNHAPDPEALAAVVNHLLLLA